MIGGPILGLYIHPQGGGFAGRSGHSKPFAMPSGITKVKGGPRRRTSPMRSSTCFLGPEVQAILATKAFVAPTNPENAQAGRLSQSHRLVRARLGFLRQGARGGGVRSLEPDLTKVEIRAPPMSR